MRKLILLLAMLMMCIPAQADEVDSLIATMKYDEYDQNRADAALALGDTGDSRAIEPLIEAVQIGKTADIRANAVASLSSFKDDERTIDTIKAALSDDRSPDVRMSAVWALSRLGDQGVIPIMSALNDTNPDVRASAAGALSELKDSRATPALINMLQKSSSKDDRYYAVTTLGSIKSPDSVNSLIEALSDPVGEVRAGAANALGEIGDPRAIPYLNNSLTDSDQWVRNEAAGAIEKINGPKDAPQESPLSGISGGISLVIAALFMGRRRQKLEV